MCVFIDIKVWSSLVLLRLLCALAKMQILIQQVWSRVWDSAFLTSSHTMLILQVHFGEQGSSLAKPQTITKQFFWVENVLYHLQLFLLR